MKSYMPQSSIDNGSTMVQVMAWCRQASSHYSIQWRLSAIRIVGERRFYKFDVGLLLTGSTKTRLQICATKRPQHTTFEYLLKTNQMYIDVTTEFMGSTVVSRTKQYLGGEPRSSNSCYGLIQDGGRFCR